MGQGLPDFIHRIGKQEPAAGPAEPKQAAPKQAAPKQAAPKQAAAG